MNQTKVICFGEVLWDMLPTGKMAGGAPMNVAYHLNNFGVNATMISRVGKGALGKELMAFFEEKEVETTSIQHDEFYNTGTVKVTLDEKGTPTYEIVRPVAWDYINQTVDNVKLVAAADAFVYGSLAARNNRTRETLLHFLELAKLKVFDVNLRAPFYTQEQLTQFLQSADIVKMNDEELALIGSWYSSDNSLPKLATIIKEQFDLDVLIVTLGSKGAFALDKSDNIHSVEGKKITVVDTIGSGDSFLAGFLANYLKNQPIKKCLEFAAKTGALVATYQGGTPKINAAMVEQIT
ncbi:MAG: carbohydrate kinase [Bacteroidota bacterium]